MTSLPVDPLGPSVPPEFASILRRLDAAGGRFRLAAALQGAGQWLTLVIPLTTLLLFLAGFFSLPHWLNIALLALTLAAWALGYRRFLHEPLFRKPTYAQIARLCEQNAALANIPLRNELINAILLAQEFDQARLGDHPLPLQDAAWIPHVIRELSGKTCTLPLEKTVPWRQPRNALSLSAGLILACLLIVLLLPPIFAHGLAVLAHPAGFVPIQGSIHILSIEPGNDTVLAGQSVNFTLTVDSPHHKIVPATIAMTFASGKSVTYPMSIFGSENAQYRYQLPTAAEDIDYIISAGETSSERSQSEKYHLTVLPQIHLVAFKLEATPPAYTGADKLSLALSGKDATAPRASVAAPLGSAITLAVTLDIPAREVLLDVQNASPIVLSPAGDGKTFTASFTLKDSMKYAIRANDSANRTLRSFPSDDGSAASADASQYAIAATPDDPPTISITEPAKDIDAQPGEKIALAASAADVYGLTQLSLEIAKNGEPAFHPIQTWPVQPEKPAAPNQPAKPARNAAIQHILELPATEYKLGDALRYRFVATDNRDLAFLDPKLTAQSTPSEVFSINFNDTAAAAAKTSKLWDQLRQQLTGLLDRQLALRKKAADLTPDITLDDLRQLIAPITQGQSSVRSDMAQLTRDFPFEPSMKLVQKSLQVLVLEDAASAIDRSSDIALLSQTKALPPLANRLRQHQDRIIDVLQTLLAIAQADERHPAKVLEKSGEDLPNEARDAWKKLADELKNFEKDQKAVIDATADLAKKPKDSFDARDNQKVADLAAAEDKWEKFLNDRLADMSKIAEQDQANASLLDEMVQMKVELAAAKDALQQKATEIATPLEENGLENAKALDTHIERMLMNTPDHTAWQMEEPVTQNDQAMAELPKQLQDMVGDLMDKEEDLTDEMESVGSKFADSLNKGAGWDAADGPISNMSAQGVTGNQMPKNMEIQGRSGEGREGRSSGEFVGSEAVGKGGRRTPTRMTDDPFSSGQVDDKSKEPAGGATGGGKKEGFGGEGLEGQAPPELNDTLRRLAGAQAAIRNQAERINLQMHAAAFNNFKLLEADALMKKAEDALHQYHYHNALYYQEKAVQSLNTAKVLAAGERHVVLDTTPQTSEKIHKEIESALSGPLPKGYADPVKAYFEKLANDQSTANP